LEEECVSSPPLFLTGPVHPPDMLRCSPRVFGEGCEREVATAKGCPGGGADSGLSVFFMCEPDNMELKRFQKNIKAYKFPRIAKIFN